MSRLTGGLALVALALLTASRVAVWQSDVTLWADAVQTAPFKPRPVLNLAAALINQGDLDAAQQLVVRAMALADARTGYEHLEGRALAYSHQAVIELRRGDRVSAFAHLSGALTSGVPAVLALCLQFHCRPDGDPIYGGTK